MFVAEINAFINIKDIKAIRINEINPKIVVIIYLNNGGETNITCDSTEQAQYRLEMFSKKAEEIQNKRSLSD